MTTPTETTQQSEHTPPTMADIVSLEQLYGFAVSVGLAHDTRMAELVGRQPDTRETYEAYPLFTINLGIISRLRAALAE